jgi:hypothetical protein
VRRYDIHDDQRNAIAQIAGAFKNEIATMRLTILVPETDKLNRGDQTRS